MNTARSACFARSFAAALLAVAVIALVSTAASAAAAGSAPSAPKCKGGRGFLFQAEPPKPQPALSFCRHYKLNSCCNRTHSDVVLAEVLPTMKADLASRQFSPACTEVTIEAKCAICEPSVGSGMKSNVCPSFCNRWHRACTEDLFSFSESKQRLVPCGANDLICSPSRLIASTGREFCELMGLNVGEGDCWSGASSPVDLSFAAYEPSMASASAGGSGAGGATAAFVRAAAASYKNALYAGGAGAVLVGVGTLLLRVQAKLRASRAGGRRAARERAAQAAEVRLKRSA